MCFDHAIRSGRSPNLRLPFAGESEGALADWLGEGLVRRDAPNEWFPVGGDCFNRRDPLEWSYWRLRGFLLGGFIRLMRTGPSCRTCIENSKPSNSDIPIKGVVSAA